MIFPFVDILSFLLAILYFSDSYVQNLSTQKATIFLQVIHSFYACCSIRVFFSLQTETENRVKREYCTARQGNKMFFQLVLQRLHFAAA